LVADVEFDAGDGFVGGLREGGRGDEAWSAVRIWCSTDADLVPGDAAGAVDEEVFQEV
jgi:hypothetical protein